jgi:DNA-binding NarL/FixJ family response regulator
MNALRIVISSGKPLFITGSRAALDDDGGFEVVATVLTAGDTVAAVAEHAPDVVLADADPRDGRWLVLVRRILARSPETSVVLMSESPDLAHAQAAAVVGAHGYLVANLDLRDLPAAIRLAVRESAYFARGLPALDGAAAARGIGLTSRELTVLRGIARNLSNREVARELWVTEHTVKFHLTNIYRKTGVANRIDAVRWAVHHGLV